MDKRSPNGLNQFFLIICTFFILSGTSVNASDDDPFEPVNRVVFGINDTLDKVVLKPTAKVYKAIMPNFAERGVRNFFSNLGEVRNAVHNTLQGKVGGTARSTGRFLINSTVGIGGLFDVASKIGIEQKREDLGQTLGVWGINSGPYLVLPLVGPSSLRDGLGVVADPFLSPLTYTTLNVPERLGVGLVSGIQTRADLLAAEGMLNGDTYTLYRQAYLSKRQYDVNDGIIINDEFIDDDLFESTEEEFLDEQF